MKSTVRHPSNRGFVRPPKDRYRTPHPTEMPVLRDQQHKQIFQTALTQLVRRQGPSRLEPPPHHPLRYHRAGDASRTATGCDRCCDEDDGRRDHRLRHLPTRPATLRPARDPTPGKQSTSSLRRRRRSPAANDCMPTWPPTATRSLGCRWLVISTPPLTTFSATTSTSHPTGTRRLCSRTGRASMSREDTAGLRSLVDATTSP